MSSDRRHTPLAHGCEAPHSCPRGLRLEVLAHTPYFADLPAAALEDIDRRLQVRGYQEDEVIHRIGTPADGLYLLAQGRVKVVRPTAEGTDVVIDVVTPGQMFGSLAALGHATYPDTAQALTVSCALRISAADFRAVLAEHPDVALRVLDEVATRLEHTRERVRRLSGGTVEQRVAGTLLALADQVGERRGDAVLLQLPLTRSDLAAMTGTTTESVSRTLSRFRRDGLVETGRRWTSVTDRDGLEAVAGAPAAR